MTALDDRIVVTDARDLHIDGKQLHHRDYPEVHARSHSSRDAARLLLLKLAHFRDTTSTDRDRALIDRAIGDVERFARRCGRRAMTTRKR